MLLRCLSLCLLYSQPESAPGKHHYQVIIIQNISPAGARRSRWDDYTIQGDNPVYSVVKKWGEMSFRNLVDGWTEWEGTARGESVEFHWGMKWLLLFLTGLCSHIKKGWEAKPIIDPTFWIFLSLFFFSSPLLYGCTHLKCCPQRKGTASWQPPQLSGLCHCDSHSGAALGLVVGRAVLASSSHTLMEKGCI